MRKLKLAHLNVRSLLSNFLEFKKVVLEQHLDVVCVSETWLSNNTSNNHVSIDGYTFHRRDRTGRGGGVGVYLRSELKHAVLNFDPNNIEQLWLGINVGSTKIAICAVYRPPDLYYRQFLCDFETNFSLVLPNFDHVFCLGDFNIDLLNSGSNISDDVSNVLYSMGLRQVVNEPTRITATSVTLIDFILTTCEDLIAEVTTVHVPEVSDHELISCVVNVNTCRQRSTYKSGRDFKHFNFQQFQYDLQSIPWRAVYEADNIDTKVDIFNSNIAALLNIHAPVVRYRITKPYAPWLTNSLKAMISDRDKALRRFKRSGCSADWISYKQLRNMTTLAVKKEKRAYFNFKIANKNQKDLWSTFRSLGVVNNKIFDVPESFQDVDAININLLSRIPDIQPDTDFISLYTEKSKAITGPSFKIQPVSESEILNIIRNIKSKATGLDGINISTFLLCVPYLLPVITHIINFCLRESVVPECWKKAKIILIPKVSNSNNIEDYRPISILPTFSKILEKAIEIQMQGYLRGKCIIPSTQSGFRRSFSCGTALLNITDDIIKATDEGKLTLLILLDFSKAFDTLNHRMLLSILQHIGVHGHTVDLFHSFLSNRKQAVIGGSHISKFLNVTKGVPQGSILGPLLFQIYISNFPNVFLSCRQHYYADDTQVYLSFNKDESEQAVAAVNYDLHRIFDVSQKHCLMLNHGKSVAIVFGKKKDREQFLAEFKTSLFINSGRITFQSCVKNLGLHMDSDLRFSQHVSNKVKSAYGRLKMLYPYRHFLDKRTKTLLCDSLVLSQFSYCDAVYGPCITRYDSDRIQRVQNSCLRLIHGIRKFQHISHTLQLSGWLNMRGRRYVHSACLFHGILTTKTPPYLYNKITYRTDVHNVNIRFRHTLTPPAHHTELFKRCFSYNIANMFNNFHFKFLSMSKRTFRREVSSSAMLRQ